MSQVAEFITKGAAPEGATRGSYETLDSGAREQFGSGMQRDLQEGKVRVDLALDGPVANRLGYGTTASAVGLFKEWYDNGGVEVAVDCIKAMCDADGSTLDEAFKDYVELMARGAEKYDARNWMKAEGPEEYERFRSSGARHFQQWLDGEHDEDHKSAVRFNMNGAEYVMEQMWDEVAAEAQRESNYVYDRFFVGMDVAEPSAAAVFEQTGSREGMGADDTTDWSSIPTTTKFGKPAILFEEEEDQLEVPRPARRIWHTHTGAGQSIHDKGDQFHGLNEHFHCTAETCGLQPEHIGWWNPEYTLEVEYAPGAVKAKPSPLPREWHAHDADDLHTYYAEHTYDSHRHEDGVMLDIEWWDGTWTFQPLFSSLGSV